MKSLGPVSETETAKISETMIRQHAIGSASPTPSEQRARCCTRGQIYFHLPIGANLHIVGAESEIGDRNLLVQ